MNMKIHPKWTEQMYRKVGGQDHLGLGSVVTDKILPTLSPGINVLTPHPRYWSFYAFVVDEFWRRDLPRTSRSLQLFLRRKESIFSIAGHLCTNPEHRSAPIGSRRVAPLVKEKPTKFSTDFDYMKSSGGGYGLYYATVMQTTGVVRLADPSRKLPADTVTPHLGVAVAEAYREAISGTRYWKRYFDSDEVPADVVEELATVCCLCRLREDPADREPLVDVFLHGGHEADAYDRRLSLQMMLELSHQNQNVALNQDDFRRLVLYGSAYDMESDEEIATFVAPTDLISVTRRWRISQLREMFNWSLNGMWQWVCDWGLERSGDVFSVKSAELHSSAAALRLSEVPGVSCGPSDPIEKLIDETHVLASMTDSLDGRWELWADLTEDHLLSLIDSGDLSQEGRLSALFVMYVMSLSRLWEPELQDSIDALDWRPVLEGGVMRIGMQYAIDQLRADVHEGRTIAEVVWRVLNEQVIAQHERVALAKLPDDTFRFRRDSDRIRFFDQPREFQRNSSRFDALATVCAELGWTGHLDNASHILSPEGQMIRTNGDFVVGQS